MLEAPPCSAETASAAAVPGRFAYLLVAVAALVLVAVIRIIGGVAAAEPVPTRAPRRVARTAHSA
jgi:hypothetical protein